MRLRDERIPSYLTGDSLLQELFDELSGVPALRTILVDITHKCNLRCKGCYFFEENLDRYEYPKAEEEFDRFLANEKARGTTFITVVGGEPTLMLTRLKR